MIHIIPVQIHKDGQSGKEDYLLAKCAKFEKALKAGAPERDAGQDDEKKKRYLQHLLQFIDAPGAEISLTPVADAEAQATIRTLKEKVDSVFPLIEGETLLQESSGRMGRALYWKQVTNLATLCFTDDSLLAACEETAATPPPPALSDNAQEEAEALQKIAKNVLDIGKGLSKVVPSPYGSVLSGVLEGIGLYVSMGSTKESAKETEKTIQRIGELVGKITWENNVKQTVKEQTGVINGVLDGLNDHYIPLKKDARADITRKELVDNYLTPFLLKLDTVIATLSLDEFDIASLPEYCLTANTYFCVLQELAVLDHEHQDNPFQSPYCKELKEIKAPRFIRYVNDTYDKILNKARESVSATTEYANAMRAFRLVHWCPSCNDPEKALPGEFRIGLINFDLVKAWYYDNSTFSNTPYGYEFCLCHPNWAYDECGKARDSWIGQKQRELISQIESELGVFKRLANEEWTKLKTHPLYGSDGAQSEVSVFPFGP